MRWKLFTDKAEADAFAEVIEGLIAATKPVRPTDKRAVWIEHLGKWAVLMEIEPDGVSGEIVDSVEPPIIIDPELP